MASTVALTLNEDNDEDIVVVITTNEPADGTILNLTGDTVEAYVKKTASTSDTDASTWKGSTATTGVALTDAVNGKVTVSIPASAVTTDKAWWRVDVINSTSKRKTAVYGALTVIDT